MISLLKNCKWFFSFQDLVLIFNMAYKTLYYLDFSYWSNHNLGSGENGTNGGRLYYLLSNILEENNFHRDF